MALPTLAELKQYLGIDAGNTEHDAVLQASLNAAIAYVERSSGLRLRDYESGGVYVNAIADQGANHLWFDPIPGYDKIERWNDGTWEDVASQAQAVGLQEWRSRGGGDYQFLIGLSLLDTGSFRFSPAYRWRVRMTADADAATELCSATIKRLAAYLYHARDAQTFEVAYNPATGELTIPRGIPADVVQMIQACRVVSL